MGALGIFVEHGGIHHPESQGIAERKVGIFKETLARNPSRPGKQVQELVNALNMREGFPPGVGSLSQRMFDRDLRATLPSLTSAPVQAQHLPDKLAASRDRAQGRRKKCSGSRISSWGTVLDVVSPGQAVQNPGDSSGS